MASRDFLGRFGSEEGAAAERAGTAAGGESDEIELSLGLSLGGCFGADPAAEAKKPRLVRSSSIASISSLPGSSSGAGAEDLAAAVAPPEPLMRTSSLPTETEEERFRRRAMQSERRLAAKRKRLERRNSMNSGRSSAAVPEVAAYSSGFQFRRSVPASQGSTSSSSLPEQRGASGVAEGKSTTAVNTSSDNTSGQNTSLPPPTPAAGRPANGGAVGEQPPLRTLRSLTMRTASTGDLRRSMMEDMPMVSSRVDGPNVKRIEGFLYRYQKGEELRIVCVCHGRFLTPAEFVRHAGGGDVTNPLRHIVVQPSSTTFV